MKNEYYQVILEKYKNKERDFSGLLQGILSVAGEVGLERALGYLERCVMGKLLTKRIRKW